MRIEFEKKSISPVIATVLLLSVAIISVISFSNWFASFQSNIMSEVEISSKTNNELTIDTFTGNNLYLSGNNEIKKISINGVICSENLSVSGNVKVDLSNCLLNLKQGKYNVVLETNNGVKKRSIFLKNEIKEISLETVTKSISGLVGYWNFNDGTAKDLSGNGNDGTLIGDVKIENGKAIFDGDYDCIQILKPFNFTELTFYAKLELNGYSSCGNFLSIGGNPGWRVRAMSGGSHQINFLNVGNSISFSDSSVGLEESISIFIINSKNSSKLYINGILRDTINRDFLKFESSFLNIGCYQTSSSLEYFNGEIDEIFVFNTSLTETQIQKIYELSLK